MLNKIENIIWNFVFFLLGASFTVPYMGYQIVHAEKITINAVVLQNKYYIQKIDKTVLRFGESGIAIYDDGTMGWTYGVKSLYWLPNY